MYRGTFLVLGGAGLVGTQVCRQCAGEFRPRRIVVASLRLAEAETVVRTLADHFPETEFVPESGNLFVPTELAHLSRAELLAERTRRRSLRAALYGDYRTAYASNHLVNLILRYRPEVIVDCVNTATGISYQDVFDGAKRLIDDLDAEDNKLLADDLELFLLSQSVPQIIRHVRFVYDATREVGTRVYIKIGTTGTGGMGLNIPYTHSEDRPSNTLLAKTEVAFGHTGLLFLMARTPDAPVVKEIVPAAMIGYKAVEFIDIRDPATGRPRSVFEPRAVDLGASSELVREDDPTDYAEVGPLQAVVVNTGENGIFTPGEFATITALGQMEFVTPEEIARNVVLELRGLNPGVDVIGAIDSAVMGPSYRAGLLRQVAMRDMRRLQAERDDNTVALGQLGPPEVSKLLYEADLLRRVFPRQLQVLTQEDADDIGDEGLTPEQISQRVAEYAVGSDVVRRAVSVGVPVLLPDGHTLLRGPRINIPELKGHARSARIEDAHDIDTWAHKGWIDLRPANMKRWFDRFKRMRQARRDVYFQGSAAVDLTTYLGDGIEIGEVVAWIFNNELGGYRLK